MKQQDKPENVANIKCLCGHEIWDDELGWLDLCVDCEPTRCSMCNCIVRGVEGENFFAYDDNDEFLLIFCWNCETKYNRNVPT